MRTIQYLLYTVLIFLFVGQNNTIGQFSPCYYFKSEIAGYYYSSLDFSTAFRYLDELSREYPSLTRSDYFKLAICKSRLDRIDFKDDLKNYLRAGGEMKGILNNYEFHVYPDFIKDSTDYIAIIDSIQNIENKDKRLHDFLEQLESCVNISNYVRNNNMTDLYRIVDSTSFLVLKTFLLDENFMNNLKPTPLLNNKGTKLLAFLIHAGYYSKEMSDINTSICLSLLEKNIIRPKDYWYIHYRRLEVLDQGKSKIFEKGNEEEIKDFRLKIGMFLEDYPVSHNEDLLYSKVCTK